MLDRAIYPVSNLRLNEKIRDIVLTVILNYYRRFLFSFAFSLT